MKAVQQSTHTVTASDCELPDGNHGGPQAGTCAAWLWLMLRNSNLVLHNSTLANSGLDLLEEHKIMLNKCTVVQNKCVLAQHDCNLLRASQNLFCASLNSRIPDCTCQRFLGRRKIAIFGRTKKKAVLRKFVLAQNDCNLLRASQNLFCASQNLFCATLNSWIPV